MKTKKERKAIARKAFDLVGKKTISIIFSAHEKQSFLLDPIKEQCMNVLATAGYINYKFVANHLHENRRSITPESIIQEMLRALTPIPREWVMDISFSTAGDAGAVIDKYYDLVGGVEKCENITSDNIDLIIELSKGAFDAEYLLSISDKGYLFHPETGKIVTPPDLEYL